MIGRTLAWFLIGGILTAATGCDNVAWEGVDVSLRGPPSDTVAWPPDSAQARDSLRQPLDLGPLLYAGTRQGDTAFVFPVAELAEGGLRPLGDTDGRGTLAGRILRERMSAGEAFTLFHEGIRIGTLVTRGEGGMVEDLCPPRPRASGPLQLTPSAMATQRFLALRQEPGENPPFRPFRQLQSDYGQRTASLNLAAEAITREEIPWPPSLLESRVDLQILQLSSGSSPSILATFLHRDQLRVGPAPEGAYSLMILGEPGSQGTGFDLAFAWHRPVAGEGKRAPRYFSRLDWDRDGDQEVLLEILGEERRWFAALHRQGTSWSVTYEDPCPIRDDNPGPAPSGLP